jgi:hypothetical protein
MVREMLTLLGTAAPSELGSAVFHAFVFFTELHLKTALATNFSRGTASRMLPVTPNKGGRLDTMRRQSRRKFRAGASIFYTSDQFLACCTPKKWETFCKIRSFTGVPIWQSLCV